MQLPSHLLAAATAASALAFCSAASAQLLPKTQINIGGSNGTGADGIGFAAKGSNFYAVWAEREGAAATAQDIWFSSSADDGNTWTAPVRVDTGELAHLNDSDQPRLAVTDDGTIVVVFQEFRDAVAAGSTVDCDAFYNRSTDGGVTWMPSALPLNVNTAGANIATDIDRISIGTSGNFVYVGWEEDEFAGLGAEEEVKVTVSSDAGATWTAPVAATPTAPQIDDADDPKVAGNGATVVVAAIMDVGGQDDVMVYRSTDAGATFIGQAVETSTSGDVDTARLYMDGDNVMVAWFDDDANGSNDNEIHAVISTDGGATFGPEINLTPTVGANAPATAHDFDLWVDGSSFYCAYTDDSAAIAGGGTSTINAGRLSLARSTDSGATFTSVVVNTDPADVNQRPHMAAMANRVVIHSEIGTNGNNLLGYYTSLDGGASFGPVDMVMNAGPDVDSEDDNNGTAMAISPVTGTAISAFWDNNSPTALNEVFISGVRGAQMSLGTSYCGPAVPNSSGQPSSMEILGSPVAADNDMTLRAVSLPPTSFGFFVTSQMQGFVMNPGGSEGNLCLSGGIGRFVGPGQIQNSGQTGAFEIQIDLNQQPTPGGLVSVIAGETWNFQAWHRDAVGGMSTSNFSDGRSLVFQ